MKKRLLLLALPLGSLLFSSCQNAIFSSSFDEINVVIEQGNDFTSDVPSRRIKRGADASFTITCQNGAALVASDYANYSIENTGTRYVYTAHSVRYSTTIVLSLSYHYCLYDANGGLPLDGSGSTSPIAKPVSPDHLRANAELGQNLFYKTGYTFNGWNTNPDGGGDNILPGSRFDFTEGLTLYAQWILETPNQDFEYDILGKSATITKYLGTDETCIVPETLGGAEVKTISKNAFVSSTLKSLYLPRSLTSLEEDSLNCSSLNELSFFDTLSEVDDLSLTCPQLSKVRLFANQSPRYSGTYYDAFSDKTDYLRKEATHLKIVLFSGSSGRYGYSSPQIEEAFPNYHIINLGVYAWANARPLMEWARHFMAKDDILLDAPEFDARDAQFCISSAFDHHLWAMVESDYGLLSLLDLRNYTNFFTSYHEFNASRSSMSEKNYFVSAKNYSDEGDLISYPTYNDNGDYLLFRANSASDTLQALELCDYTRSSFSDLYFSSLNAAHTLFTDQGIRVFFSYSPRNWSSLTAQSTPEERKALDQEFRASIKAPVISKLEDCLFSGVYFYRYDSHLSTEGALLRTERIIADLKAQGLN